jgi:cyclase
MLLDCAQISFTPITDILNMLCKGNADVALVASLFHFGTYTIEDVKHCLKNKGVEVR